MARLGGGGEGGGGGAGGAGDAGDAGGRRGGVGIGGGRVGRVGLDVFCPMDSRGDAEERYSFGGLMVLDLVVDYDRRRG